MKLTNATIKQIIVSTDTIGNRLRLCGVRPYYAYVDGNRTDTIAGYAYTVTCPGMQYERLDIKVPGKQLLTEKELDSLVTFPGLSLHIYPSYIKGQRGIEAVNLRATAESVSVIDG